MLKGFKKEIFRNFLIGDDSWFTLQFRHSVKWAVLRDNVPQNVRQLTGILKCILTVMQGVDGFHVVYLTNSKETFNSQNFVDNPKSLDLIDFIVAPEKCAQNRRGPLVNRFLWSILWQS
jgi:hypothetical protein